MIAKGSDRRAVAKGIHLSIVKRALSLMRRVGMRDQVAFVGGVARSPAMRQLLQQELQKPVFVPDDPQIVGVLGYALASPGRENAAKL